MANKALTLLFLGLMLETSLAQYVYASGYSTYYTSPLYCYGTSIYTWSATMPTTASYTACQATACYDYYTRNYCCMTYLLTSEQLLYQQCRCDNSIACGVPPKINPTTASTVTTTTPTTTTTTPTTTTTTPTTTITTTTTTTTTPTTTTTTPTTTTTTPTTTTTTTPTPTTSPPSLCATPAFRILNGAPVSNDCAFSGISNITVSAPPTNIRRVSCNAVLITTTIDGVLKKTFLTTTICKNVITSFQALNSSVEISIGNQNYPIVAPIFTLTDGINGVAYITINDRYTNLLGFLGTCQTTACAYNEATMTGKVDFTNCKIVSWGSSDAATLGQKGLYETAITYSPLGCTTIANLFGANTTMCFRTTSGKNLFCSGDSGAPVYCKAPSNGEWILMGVAAMQTSCNATPEVKVVPYPR